jgi:hypothetical protein
VRLYLVYASFMPKAPKITRAVGFYLVEGFWADAKPDYSMFNSRYWLTPGFNQLMEEVVVSLRDGSRKVEVHRDGLIAYSEPELHGNYLTPVQGRTFQRIEKYTEILNALAIALTATVTSKLKTKYHTNFELTHHDIFGMMYEDGKFKGMGLPQKSVAGNQINKRFLGNVPANCVDCLDLYIDSPPRPIVSKQILEEAIHLFFKLTKTKDNTRLLARANKAAAEYAGTSFSDCILIAWLPVEVYLYERLKKYMNRSGTPRFNSKRKQTLTKDYTVSQIIELLEFGKQLTNDEYDKLSRVRRVRNTIIHDGHVATFEEAGEALALLESIIKTKTKQSIALNTGISMNMF